MRNWDWISGKEIWIGEIKVAYDSKHSIAESKRLASYVLNNEYTVNPNKETSTRSLSHVPSL